MKNYTLFDYPLHQTFRQHPVPLEGVPSIPEAVAARCSRFGEDELLNDSERQACDDAIEAACHVLFERERRLLEGKL